jgi:DNA-binding transcriptional MerR regulator
MGKVDMSEKAVLRRLRQVDQLRELGLSLMKAKKLHDEKHKGRSTIDIPKIVKMPKSKDQTD